LLDVEGNLIGNATQEYSPLSIKPGWIEQHPDDWYEAVKGALQQLQTQTGFDLHHIAAIGTAGQMRGLTFLDQSGKPGRNSILWNDLRCAQEVVEAKNEAGDLLKEITHNPLNTMCTLPKILWIMRNDPTAWERTNTIVFPKDYVNYRLTGSIQTDSSDASGSSFYDIRKQTWSEEILDLFGIAREKFPEIYPSTEVIGRVSQKASEETGLSQGTPVIAGGSDATVELFAVGVKSASQCKIRLGTSGALSTVVEDLGNFPKGDYYCWSYVLPNHWMIDLNTRACAHSTVWLRDVFFKDKPTTSEAYGEIEKEAQTIPIGSDGLVFHPYLLGEDAPYWNPNLKGSFFGVTASHTRQHFARAVFEGTAYALRDARSMIEAIAQNFSEYIFVGGGVKNALWVSIVADVLGINGKISTKADTSLGAAMLAGIGTGIFTGVDDAVRKCQNSEKAYIKHDKNNHEIYNTLFKRYVQMKRVYDQIYKIS
jgi:xylulokinase